MQPESYKEIIPAALAGERLDRAVCLVADISRSSASQLISAGKVSVDGQQVTKTSYKLDEGKTVEFELMPATTGLEPDDSVEFGIVYQDEHIVVVDKPAGLVVHPGAGNESGTLANGLLARFPQIAEVGEVDRPGIVHRLDRETSGLLAVALTNEAHMGLSEMLAARVIDRTYLVLVEGSVENSHGAVDAPITRSTTDYRKMVISAGGKPSVTNFERLEQHEATSLLSCKLESGRTHQIRVHMSSIGHPVYGDQKYGSKFDMGDRFFLHSQSLAFIHPVSDEPCNFESELPKDLQAILDSLS